MNAVALVTKLLEDDPDVIRPKDYLRQLPARKQERWCFSSADLQQPENCHSYDELVANVITGEGGASRSVEFDNEEQTDVIVYRNGIVTNKFDDGTIGVPKEIQKLADDVEELVNPRGNTDETAFCNVWRNVWTDETGVFLGWAPEE
jgi:hypothetical protein